MILLSLMLFVSAFACVDQPPTDSRIFHCETLDNGLSLLVVEDPNATDAAASMYVDVGSKDNPKGREGLAHFLEHMLFMGTKEYPDVGEFMNYAQAHGGFTNASTAEERTVYYFYVKPEYFQKGVDMFTSFFIEPLFLEDYVDRERNAVNSEYIMGKQSDGRRLYAVLQAVMGDHPRNRFHVGSLETLHTEHLREDLIDFYNTHYSSDKMYFVAVVPENAAQYLAYFKERLSQVPKREVMHIEQVEKPRLQAGTGKFLKVKKLEAGSSLEVAYILPSQQREYKRPSGDYILSMLNYQGKGSLGEVLKEKGLIVSLTAGVENGLSETESFLCVSFDLTEKGFLEYENVLSALNDYIEKIKQDGVKLSRFQDMQKVGFLEYLYYSTESAVSQVNYLANRMKHYPSHKWYSLPFILEDSQFDPSHIHLLLSRMQFQNALVILESQDVATDRVEPYYDVGYSVSKTTDMQYKRWQQKSNVSFSLPGKNPYIPDSISLLEGEVLSEPKKIGKSTWYMNSGFKQPRQFVNYWRVLESKTPKDDIRNTMLRHLLSFVLENEMSLAVEAGSSISVFNNHQGISIVVSGMGDKQEKILSEAISRLENLEVSETKFNMIKQEMLESFDNMNKQKPVSVLSHRLREMLTPTYQYEALQAALLSMDIEDFKSEMKLFLENSQEKRFYFGNIGEDLPLSEDNITLDKTPILLGENQDVYYNPEPEDHAAITYFQASGNSDEDKLYAHLVAQMLESEFYQQLRTEEQIGYIVQADSQLIHNWPGVVFLVQSPHMKSGDIKARIDRFLEEASFWDEERFETVKQSLLSELRRPFQTMHEEFSFYRNEIGSQEFDYDKRDRMANVLEGMTLEGVKTYYKNMVARDKGRVNLLTE